MPPEKLGPDLTDSWRAHFHHPAGWRRRGRRVPAPVFAPAGV